MFKYLEKKITNFITLAYLIKLRTHDLEKEKVIKKIQDRNVRKLMRYAYTVPFYRKKFDERNLKPEDFKTAEDLAKFPVLTKTEIREWILPTVKGNPTKYKYWTEVSTSGSTGTPLSIYVTPRENAILAANWLRMGMCNGVHILKDKTMALKDPKIVAARNGRDSIIQKFGILRRYCLPFTSDGKTILETMNREKPDYIYLHRSKLLQTIMYAERNNIDIHLPKLCGIIGEGVDENSKELIFKYFSESMFSSYGTMETGACTFTKRGTVDKHVVTRDTHVINLINEEGKNDKHGKMVITNLFFRGFPIINYDVNDGAEIVTEHGVSYLQNIKGRLNDVMYFSDGSVVDWLSFYSVMENRKDILQFRVVQETYKDITIQLVEKKQHGNEHKKIEKEIEEDISKLISDKEVVYQFEWLDELKPDKNGKRRFIISKVQQL